MRKNILCCLLVLTGLLINSRQASSQWVTDTIADTFDTDLLAIDPLAFDADNNVYAIYIKEVPTGPMGMSQNEVWYLDKPNGGTWSEAIRISGEEENTFFQSIAVSPEGEVYICYRAIDGFIIKKKNNDQWESVEYTPIGLNNGPAAFSVGSEGVLHLVYGAKIEEGEGFYTQLIYATNSSGEFVNHNIPDSENPFSQMVNMDIAEDGSIHILYEEFLHEESKTQFHYLTNRTGDWVKTPVFEPLNFVERLGIKCNGSQVHIAAAKKEVFNEPEQVYYYRIEGTQFQDTLMLDHDQFIFPLSFNVSESGEVVFAISEGDNHFESYGLLFSRFTEGEWQTTQIYDDTKEVIDAYVTFDSDENLMIMANLGEWESSVFLLYEEPVFSAEFSIFDQDQQPVTDAVITLGEISNDAGHYVFEDLEPGTYQYSVSREGYYTYEDEITIVDQDLEIHVELETDYTGTPAVSQSSCRIYPNPASEKIFISAAGIIISAEVYDITGRQVEIIYPSSEKCILNVADLKSGIYFLKANLEEGVFSRKIIINK